MMDTFLDPRNEMPRVIIDGMIRHNIQMKMYVEALSGNKDSTFLQLAAIFHNLWRAQPKKSVAHKIEDTSHGKVSAEMAEKCLKRIKAPATTIKKIKSLILNLDKGTTNELKLLREADALSFIENTLPIWFEAGLWQGDTNDELIDVARKRLEKEFKQIKSKEGKDLAKKYYDKWTNWLEQKELG